MSAACQRPYATAGLSAPVSAPRPYATALSVSDADGHDLRLDELLEAPHPELSSVTALSDI